MFIADPGDSEVVEDTPDGSGGYVQNVVDSDLSAPQGVAVDGSGDVFVADPGDSQVLEDTPDGSGGYTQTVVDSGVRSPQGVAVDRAGDVFIVDTSNNQVLEEVPDGGGGYIQTVINSRLRFPHGVAVDGAGDVFIADTNDNRVLKDTPDGDGGYTQTVINSRLRFPHGVAVDEAGDVFIADTNDNRVLEDTPDGSGGYTQTVVDSGVRSPQGVAVDSAGDVFIADPGDSQVVEDTPDGSGGYVQSVVDSGLSAPQGVAVDGSGDVFVADPGDSQVLEDTPDGSGGYTQTVVDSGVRSPQGVAVDRAGDVFIADPGTDRVVEHSAIPPLVISSAAGALFAEGQFGSLTIITSGDPIPAVSDGGATLPSGVRFVDNGDGTATLSGTPAIGSAGSYQFTITASNGESPNATQNFTLTVPQVSPAISGAASTLFAEGQTASLTIIASGDPIPAVSDGGATLPIGVRFVDNGDGTATLSGTPAIGSAGIYQFTITASNGTSPDATQSLRLTVAPTTISTTIPSATTTPTATSTATTTITAPTTTAVTAAATVTTTSTITAAPTTGDQQPTATGVKGQSAVLDGAVAAHTTAVSYRFAYGADPRYTRLTPRVTLAASGVAHAVVARIMHLVPGRAYRYRLQITTSTGTVSYGPGRILRTPRVHPRRVRDHIHSYWDQHAPYHYTVMGRMILAGSLTLPVACQTSGRATITATVGSETLARHTVEVSHTCTYSSQFTFTTNQLAGSGRIRFHMRFDGNQQLDDRQARTLNVLYGPNAKSTLTPRTYATPELAYER